MNIEKQFMNLPSVNYLLQQPLLKKYADNNPLLLKKSIKELLAEIRENIKNNKDYIMPSEEEIIEKVLVKCNHEKKYSIKRVINATGTIIHTNLGRSILSEEIKQQIDTVAFSYSNLEYNVSTGTRGSRYQHLESIIKYLTGAESVVVVNNNAAAIILALNTLCREKEIIISRGELVEIGGSFRIPEVIKMSGVKIKEVGTTNKTHLSDYSEAINEETGAIMKVHTSNYKIIGFTESPQIEDLKSIANRNEIPIINDLGSGLLIDLQKFGLPYEPTVKEVLKSGSDIVMFSGDKLLGGPQVGIIVGKEKYIEPMKNNQLLRALRVDKLTLSALEATLNLYIEPNQALKKIPTLKMISQTYEECLSEATKFEKILLELNQPINIIRKKGYSQIGGGAYPESKLESEVIGITIEGLSSEQLEERLRQREIPIITRIKNDMVWFDVRTLGYSDMEEIVEAINQIICNF